MFQQGKCAVRRRALGVACAAAVGVWAMAGAGGAAALGAPVFLPMPLGEQALINPALLSGDGRVVAGSSDSGGVSRAWRWSIDQAGETFIDAPVGAGSMFVSGLSADGARIVGTAETPGSMVRAWDWQAGSGGGGAFLVSTPGSNVPVESPQVSGDGARLSGLALDSAVVLGSGGGGGVTILPDVNGQTPTVTALSFDGGAAAGLAGDLFVNARAFRWSDGGGAAGVTGLPAGFRATNVTISGDGQRIAGVAMSTGFQSVGFVAGADGVAGALPLLPVGGVFWPRSMSSDGLVMLGDDDQFLGQWVYVEGQGYRSVSEF
ncbi:MAG TPA: hypothetical protein PL072_11485, partial [Phycisphaerales bacterium]|nr:hypothetical protein [Phycisphaerales bacterium]